MSDRITTDPLIMVGKPVVGGTRITVEQILRDSSVGCSPDEIADMYPTLTVEDIKAALIYAADVLGRGTTLAAE